MSNQTSPTEVWGGAPVKSVHSLQDLGKLVQQPQEVQKVNEETQPSDPKKYSVRGSEWGSQRVKVAEAMAYAKKHPELTTVAIADKFGLKIQTLYSAKYKAKMKVHSKLAKARAVKAEKKAEQKPEPKKWLHATLSTSAAPVTRPIGLPREAQVMPLTIDYITRMNFSYSVGRAIECLSNGDVRGAMAYLERELNK